MTAKLSNPAAAKDPRRTWYGTALWKTRRHHQLQIEPLCAICQAEGRVTPATVADHIEPHKGNYTAFVRGVLRSLCAPCHDGLQPSFKHKPYSSAVGPDGYPIDPAHPFNRVR
jgi:5-methylcytosine-specific restriction protein A